MDTPTMLMIMIFILVCLFVTGGFALLLPLSRELAQLVRERRTGRATGSQVSGDELVQIRAALEGTWIEIATIN